METQTIIVILSALGVGAILDKIVTKVLNRKENTLDLNEREQQMLIKMQEHFQQMQEKEHEINEKEFNAQQNKLNHYIGITEKAVLDIAKMQQFLSKVYSFTCCVVNCDKRQLMDSEDFNFNVTINDDVAK